MHVKLETLVAGDRFAIPSLGRRGLVISVGAGSVRVKYDGTDQTRTFTPQAKPGEKPKKVTIVKSSEIDIAPGTMVVRERA